MRRWFVIAGALLCMAASCDSPRTGIPGDSPLRYRDEVFTSTTVTKDVVYSTATRQDGVTVDLGLDVYTPVGDTVTQRPTVVWIHGGAFKSGDKSNGTLVSDAKHFARLGYVSVAINYRVSRQGCTGAYGTAQCRQSMLDAQHDGQAAVRFLRAQADTYGIDPDRIAASGVSAGAITALHLAANADDPGDGGNPEQSSEIQGAVSVSGAALVGTIDAGDAPMVLFHGTADTTVPFQWAVDTFDRAEAAGIAGFLVPFENGVHNLLADHDAEIASQTANFLYWEMHVAQAAH